MLLFSAHRLGQSFNGTDIFRDVTFEVKQGEKLALLGPNGAGKSSLLRIIAGIDEPVIGSIKYYKPLTHALLPQGLTSFPGSTVMESLEALSANGRPLYSVGEAISKFGFSKREHQPTDQLSGGEKTRLRLAAVWLTGADLLLLDEPTNHLDLPGMDWLENFIREYPHTVILVSHDRYFLDRTVNRVLELGSGGTLSYPGNYTAYHQARMAQQVHDEKRYQEQVKAAGRLSDAIAQQEQWAEKAHRNAAAKARQSGIKASKVHYRSQAKKTDARVKSHLKRLERLQEKQVERPKRESVVDLSFTEGKRANSTILRAAGISKGFASRLLFSAGSFSLQHREKVAVVGSNGTGKTTLLRMIAGLEAPDQGELWISPSLRIGYLEQEMQSLANERTVLDELLAVQYNPKRVRTLLADLLIGREAVFKPCGVLSMGERVRVGLARLLLGTYDLLLLDEPGNYLDLASREKLEEALQEFGGSMILVSHDRYMIERVASTVWSIDNCKIGILSGGFSDYRDSHKAARPDADSAADQRLELEVRKSLVISQLSLLDRRKNESEYLRLEKEFLAIVQLLRS